MKKILSLSLFGSLLLLSSCKKNDNNTKCSLSSSSIVGSYINSGDLTQATPSSPVVDALALEAPCQRDDIVTLKAGGTYAWTDGATACTPSSLIPSGTWSLNGNLFTSNGVVATIQSFDCKTLVTISSDANGNNKQTLTLVKQ